MIDKRPTIAFEELSDFFKITKGLEINKEVRTKFYELKKDRSLKTLMKLKEDLDKAIKKYRGERAKSACAPTYDIVKKIEARIHKVIDSKKTSPNVKKEAEDLLKHGL